jgi:TetR/AcrR family transcriptional repressor of nem operon
MTTLSTRERLLQVGLLRFHENGYAATGIQEILEQAQVPRGSFYHHFASKEEFARAVMLQHVSREARRMEKSLKDSKLPPLKRLRQYFKELIKLSGQCGSVPGCLVGKMSLEVSSQSEVIRTLLSEAFKTWQKAIEEVLRAAVDERNFRLALAPPS